MQVRSLSFGYSGRWLFTDFSLELPRGLTWLGGVNGCNKSSLLRLLAGVLQPVASTLFAAGDDAAQDPLGYRRQIFWCGPDGIAFNHLRGDEFLRFLAGLYPHWDGAQRAKKLRRDGALDPRRPRRQAPVPGWPAPEQPATAPCPASHRLNWTQHQGLQSWQSATGLGRRCQTRCS